MFYKNHKSETFLKDSKLSALNNSQAVIEFTPEGKIRHANKNFLAALGYTLEEIQDQDRKSVV